VRVRLATRPAVLWGALFAMALLAFVPLRLALGLIGVGEQGFAAREVRGSVWAGRLVEARFGALALGDLDARLALWPLVVGRARIELDGAAGRPDRLEGAVTVGRHLAGIDDVTATLPAGRLFAPAPVGLLDLDAVSVRFRDGVCEAADGRVRATLSGALAGLGPGQQLAGTLRCEAGQLLVPLASQAGTEQVAVRLSGDGTYTARLTLAAPDEATAERLRADGFAPAPEGLALTVNGRL
jgi:general secretion pathway protein N